MRKGSASIKGSAPDKAPIVLLIVDMFGDFNSEALAPLYGKAIAAARKISILRRRATAAGIPVLFINDNEGRWRSSGPQLLVEHAKASARGRSMLQILAPTTDDYLLLKPKHSVFFATPLDTLLKYIGARALILTGLTGAQCILFSAIDAYVRDYKLHVPRDCLVVNTPKDVKVTEYLLTKYVGADVRDASRLRLASLRKRYAKVAA
jgi:isochorismate hydrolase